VDEAVALLREREILKPWRLGTLYLTSLRALLEGKRAESLEASDELRKATFRDPEGIFYQARQLSYLGEIEHALGTLSRSIDSGFYCYPAMVRDPWLDALRSRPEFTSLLRKSRQLHREAAAAFVALGGESLLGLSVGSY
jgi:hypothetical protein